MGKGSTNTRRLMCAQTTRQGKRSDTTSVFTNTRTLVSRMMHETAALIGLGRRSLTFVDVPL
ncbi:hypothetical protein BDN71DRAFT_1455274 [Pleurotus eryngii]|uniref:Uncharacterized protein n=1 Tax=Pleurotus eryngii TaxID=5323 RepID=A0A9P5ZNT3_PLEER|nr:hypothetical protein BDN71DRAFT_1455274 [Pleurotus eryngii]